MNLANFESLLFETYQMDLYYPKTRQKFVKDFESNSWKKWAIDELLIYIKDSAFPSTKISIDDYILFTNRFIDLVSKYANKYPKTRNRFNEARLICEDIVDLLNAMR